MARKQKSNSAPTPPTRGNPPPTQRPGTDNSKTGQESNQFGDDIQLADLFNHPLLICAWASLLVTMFAIWAAWRFRKDLSMGELSEPAHLIVWGAITFTLFASYRRHKRRETESDS